MRTLFTSAIAILSFTTYSQNKITIDYSNLKTVEGTNYVIASANSQGKIVEMMTCRLLFIDTKTLETHQVDFADKGYLENPQQIKIDALGINKILVGARLAKGDKMSFWNTQTRIFILSPDGSEKVQLTENNFFADSWTVNEITGALVITGNYDTNGNNKKDINDKNQILIYDLKTLKLLSKI